MGCCPQPGFAAPSITPEPCRCGLQPRSGQDRAQPWLVPGSQARLQPTWAAKLPAVPGPRRRRFGLLASGMSAAFVAGVTQEKLVSSPGQGPPDLQQAAARSGLALALAPRSGLAARAGCDFLLFPAFSRLQQRLLPHCSPHRSHRSPWGRVSPTKQRAQAGKSSVLTAAAPPPPASITLCAAGTAPSTRRAHG